MKLLDEDRLHLLAAAFNDHRIPQRFRGFRYGDCPHEFISNDGRISVRQNSDGSWTPRINRQSLRDEEGRIVKRRRPTEAKHYLFVTSGSNR